ncbi:putative nicotinate-nucleotide adenylyltransferase [Oxobacter pfennigii]|uniref:Probable nicotinate-nucleotide adenylyltransferase n=1 Tax=Oxobacter pfennigii TaxID=36849 RepID=A0A0P8YWQ7_9CLOT|nr:nicotinate-nucleotide adenylyltransferase [Oxobacter pfennigii]KPU44161.1 putative nicotinate-nucleotide adenylyltransferase [Oxobacter pfennigii]
MDNLLKRLKEQKVQRVAVMGGTFDPIHHGHLVTAEIVRVKYDFDKVVFIPSGIPPHKEDSSVTLSEHRLNMVKLAIDTNPYFEVSRMEIDRGGYTYTIDTIIEFINYLGNNLSIHFITGADVMFQILSWKDAKELLSLCKFIAVTRPGYDKSALNIKVEELIDKYKSDITILEVPAIAISSTEIRRRVNSNLSIKYLLPEKVEEYIKKNRLYINREKDYDK